MATIDPKDWTVALLSRILQRDVEDDLYEVEEGLDELQDAHKMALLAYIEENGMNVFLSEMYLHRETYDKVTLKAHSSYRTPMNYILPLMRHSWAKKKLQTVGVIDYISLKRRKYVEDFLTNVNSLIEDTTINEKLISPNIYLFAILSNLKTSLGEAPSLFRFETCKWLEAFAIKLQPYNTPQTTVKFELNIEEYLPHVKNLGYNIGVVTAGLVIAGIYATSIGMIKINSR